MRPPWFAQVDLSGLVRNTGSAPSRWRHTRARTRRAACRTEFDSRNRV